MAPGALVLPDALASVGDPLPAGAAPVPLQLATKPDQTK